MFKGSCGNTRDLSPANLCFLCKMHWKKKDFFTHLLLLALISSCTKSRLLYCPIPFTHKMASPLAPTVILMLLSSSLARQKTSVVTWQEGNLCPDFDHQVENRESLTGLILLAIMGLVFFVCFRSLLLQCLFLWRTMGFQLKLSIIMLTNANNSYIYLFIYFQNRNHSMIMWLC